MKVTKLISSFLMIACLLISIPLLAQITDNNIIPNGQIQYKEVDKDYFKNITSITPLFESGKISSSERITSFQLTRVRMSVETVELKSTSDNFTKEMIEVLTHLKSGDKLYFEYINARFADDSPMRIAPLNFLVK